MKTTRICSGCGKRGNLYGLVTYNGNRGYWHAKCLKLAQAALAKAGL